MTSELPSVLLIEDTATQAMMMMHLVKSSGAFEPTLAKNAEKAVALLETRSFDLIVSDINMPGMSGYDLTRLVKKSEKWRHIPVVLLASFMDARDVLDVLACGADSFMYKLLKKHYFVPRLQSIYQTIQMNGAGKERGQCEAELMTAFFANQECSVSTTPEQLLNMLLSCFDTAVYHQRAITPEETKIISKVG